MLQLNEDQYERGLREWAARKRFEQRKPGLLELVREQMGRQSLPGAVVRPAEAQATESWWAPLLGVTLLVRAARAGRVLGSTDEPKEWEEVVVSEDSHGLTGALRRQPSGDVHLRLQAVGEQWAEAEVLRLEVQSAAGTPVERGAICLRRSAAENAFVAGVNLGRVGESVGLKVVPAKWADVTEEEADWAVAHAADPQTLKAWQQGWAEHRARSTEEVAAG